MENRVDGAELMRESEGDRVGARFPYNVKWAQVLFQKFLGWLPSSKELCLDISLVADFQLRSLDRKSTRLNSSHQIISYAVFCLKKKKHHVLLHLHLLILSHLIILTRLR